MSFITGSTDDIHVLPSNEPIDEFLKHDKARTCWCEPDLNEQPDGVMMVLHHPADSVEEE
jgi:hypothetical protein